jgi:predicted nucleotidyltransferase
VLRWPDPDQVMQATRHWAECQAEVHPGLIAVGVYGSYGRGDAGVGSDLDLLLIDRNARGLQRERLPQPLEQLPLSCDALIPTPEELQSILVPAEGMAGRLAKALNQVCRWLWERPAGG